MQKHFIYQFCFFDKRADVTAHLSRQMLSAPDGGYKEFPDLFLLHPPDEKDGSPEMHRIDHKHNSENPSVLLPELLLGFAFLLCSFPVQGHFCKIFQHNTKMFFIPGRKIHAFTKSFGKKRIAAVTGQEFFETCFVPGIFKKLLLI